MAHMLFQFNFSMILSIYILSIFFFIYIQDSKGFSITPARPPRHRLPLQLIAERRMATLNRQRSTMNRMRPLSMDIQMLLTHHLKTTGPTTDLRKTKVRIRMLLNRNKMIHTDQKRTRYWKQPNWERKWPIKGEREGEGEVDRGRVGVEGRKKEDARLKVLTRTLEIP